MLRRSITVGTFFVLASTAAADGLFFPLLFQRAGAGFETRAPGLSARFAAGGFELVVDGARVGVSFEGSHAEPVGDRLSSAPVHRLTAAGAQSEEAFESLLYEAAWPGVDVRIHSHGGRLEYDLELAPGADLASAVLAFGAAGELHLDASGALVVPTAAGPLFLAAPVSWEVRADGAPLPRASRFELLGEGRVRMVVDGWSREQQLVVDPVLVWSRYVGGTSGDEATAVAFGPDGAAFVTGWTRSGDFPLSADAVDSKRGSEEAFLFKVAPDGHSLVWLTYFGGRDADRGLGVVVDPKTHQPIIVGRTQSSDFPATPGAFRTGRSGVRDGFVARLAADGAAVVWATYLGGSGGDELVDVALTAAGEPVVIGTTTSNDFPVTSGARQPNSGGRDDVVYAQLAVDGMSLMSSSYLGGSRDDVGTALALDGTHVWLVGMTRSSDFPVTPGAHDVTRNDRDAFVVRAPLDGGPLAFGTFLGGRDRDEASDVAVFSYLGAVVVGNTRSSDFPVTDDAFQTTRNGLEEGFLALVHRSGASVLHGTYLGGSADDRVTAVGVDEHERVWLAGMTYSSDWLMTGDAAQTELGGAGDAFVATYDPRTGERAYATLLGGTAEDQALDLALDPLGGSTLVVGYARAGLPGRADGTPDAAGARDAFLARFDHGVCGRVATVEDLGGGCGLQLSATPARMGRRMSLTVEEAPSHATGWLLASAPTNTPYPLGGGCLAMIDVDRMWVLGLFQTDAEGFFEVSFDVIDDESRCGDAVSVQALILAPGQGPSGVGWLSNAKTCRLGD
ncbi:MAG: hypothetical protein WD226_03700 [Planctomycetota bacterium]